MELALINTAVQCDWQGYKWMNGVHFCICTSSYRDVQADNNIAVCQCLLFSVEAVNVPGLVTSRYVV